MGSLERWEEYEAKREWDMGPRDNEAPLLEVIPSKAQLDALLLPTGRVSRGMLRGPFNIQFACSLLQDWQTATDDEGKRVFPDLRIVKQGKGFNVVYVEEFNPIEIDQQPEGYTTPRVCLVDDLHFDVVQYYHWIPFVFYLLTLSQEQLNSMRLVPYKPITPNKEEE